MKCQVKPKLRGCNAPPPHRLHDCQIKHHAPTRSGPEMPHRGSTARGCVSRDTSLQLRTCIHLFLLTPIINKAQPVLPTPPPVSHTRSGLRTKYGSMNCCFSSECCFTKERPSPASQPAVATSAKQKWVVALAPPMTFGQVQHTVVGVLIEPRRAAKSC